MSATAALPIWADNDRTFRLSGVKTLNQTTGKLTKDDTLTIQTFVSASDAPDASAIAGASVVATSLGNGRYMAKFDAATNLPLATMRAAAGGATATMWLHWVAAGNFHVVRELAYAETRSAT